MSRAFTVLAFAMLACALVLAGTAWAQPGTANDQYSNDDITVEQTTTPETTTTTTDSQSSDDLRAGDDLRSAAGFSCVEIVDISQIANRSQYNFSSARLQECLAREVIDGVRGDRLADTGGSSLGLLPIAAFILIGLGLFMGRAVLYRRDR